MYADEIIILLGAGASYDAGIPISSKMISNVENLIQNEKEWTRFKDLYFCLKSSIQYGFGITGKFSPNIINIETLVNSMDELIKGYDNPLYPFVGSWTPRLSDLAGKDFIEIKNFKTAILKRLQSEWMHLEHEKESTQYYRKLIDFQTEYGRALHIFSLNYDKCVEIQCNDIGVNRGFTDNHIWDWKRFIYDDNSDERIYLYKLHGSIDWQRGKDDSVVEKDSNISVEELGIIFGTSYKLQYIDPFLFLVHEFRKRTLENATKAILCIGYSFNDEHINAILRQSLKVDDNRIIISVAPLVGDEEKELRTKIENEFKLADTKNIYFVNETAKNFMENTLSIQNIEKYLHKAEAPF